MIPLLEARQLTKIFESGMIAKKQTVALRDFSMSITTEQPSITAVVGESGSGKTTMARLLLGLETPTEGKVLHRGKDLAQLNRREWLAFRREVQAIFQDPFEVYNPFYRVDHVLEVPIAKFGLANSKRERRRLIESSLQAVGLRPRETLGRFPHQLSGGQRQRIMVARALLMKPKLIIADEPVSMIDASLRATVLDNLRHLNERFGISIIYITHDLTTAFQISHNILVLYRGGVTEAGDVELVVKDPEHPYTRLLVGSIPLPNPDRVWREQPEPSALSAQAKEGQGCSFAPRCPQAFEPCLEKAPPLYCTNPSRAVTCYLYEEHVELPAVEMDSVMCVPQDVTAVEEAQV
ncbi:MAG TPA: ABC transporter ATP-binding protein [Candidatus Sulfomarinibacteraceae bacterium]|nr:ABC transporter ATP-binding protein [Candidatus Sulfomarinibacteraceae bacterium]